LIVAIFHFLSLARSGCFSGPLAGSFARFADEVWHCLPAIGDGRNDARKRIGGAVKKTDFLPRLESLRGIAALAVVGYHVSNQLSAGSENGWLDMIAHRLIIACTNGTGSVVTFFVLSGFVLARSLDRNSDPVRFFRHRLFRLFPAAIAVVTLLTVLYWKFGFYVGFRASFDLTDVILNLMMVRSDINSVMWSMTVECFASPLILLSVWLFKQHGERWLWGLIVLLVSLSSWGPYVHLLGGFTNLAPLYAFVVGVLLHFRGARYVSIISPRLATFEGIAAIVLFCFCGTRTQSALILLLECVSSATLIALIAWRPGMPLFRPLDFGVVRFYGRISYSFYLIHLLGISFAFRMINPAAMNADGMPLSLTIIFATVASILATTPAAYLSWRFIEAPAIAFGKARVRSGASTVPAGRV
jgi:exopolysaccharide production protein ExoZ